MNGTLTIARRELTEKRFVFISAIAFALLTLIVPFMPGVHAGERRNALVIASLICAVNFTLGLAAVLGSTIIGRELSDGRLSFYFSKPITASSIWFGKLIAALLLLSASFAIIAAPAMIAGFEQVVNTWANAPRDTRAVIGIVLGLAAALFLLSHVIGTFVRSRSAWLVFDFIALAVCGTAIWLLARPLLMGFAIDLIRTLALILSVYTAVAIIAAGAWQVARGRTDRKRSHIELSRFLWMSLGCGLLVMAAFVGWVVSVSVKQVKPEFVQQSSGGSWATIVGKAQHRSDYHAAFLYNVSDVRSVRLPSLQPWWGTTFAADEKTAAWFVPSPAGASELYVARLDVPMPKPTPTGITGVASFDALSDDGSRIAIVESGGLLSVYDLRSKASLGSARIPEGRSWFGGFVTPNVVRIYAAVDKKFGIFEYDIRKKTLQRTGEMPGFPRSNRDHSACVVYSNRTSLEIRDARTGSLITLVAPQVDGHMITATFLRDGRIAALENRNENSVLHLLSASGAELRSMPLPGKADVYFVTESTPGLIAVVMRQPYQMYGAAVIDVNRGVVIRTEPGLRPVNRTFGPRLLCMTPHGLVAWNPATGEKQPVAGQS